MFVRFIVYCEFNFVGFVDVDIVVFGFLVIVMRCLCLCDNGIFDFDGDKCFGFLGEVISCGMINIFDS